MTGMQFNVYELELIIEALEARAGRHESMARFNPRNARMHDRRAEGMRKLRNRIIREKNPDVAAVG